MMKESEAVNILFDYNEWRAGKPPYNECGITCPHKPSEITEAINVAVYLMGGGR